MSLRAKASVCHSTTSNPVLLFNTSAAALVPGASSSSPFHTTSNRPDGRAIPFRPWRGVCFTSLLSLVMAVSANNCLSQDREKQPSSSLFLLSSSHHHESLRAGFSDPSLTPPFAPPLFSQKWFHAPVGGILSAAATSCPGRTCLNSLRANFTCSFTVLQIDLWLCLPYRLPHTKILTAF